ncbi:hypothetical protein [Aquibacillus rhizosphaerae]|uniref:Uncharacterized protein n=1 Tax=Aquibacillus rhizosphaerae TaxID=3051431 RepID=A0ABT7L0T4_9BACI|nr:hypothetical protein [Aquibacillus sp. LR5S19]MDL4839454.1 hypothetical protein [Aquibacillus sp. LR5S19]
MDEISELLNKEPFIKYSLIVILGALIIFTGYSLGDYIFTHLN